MTAPINKFIAETVHAVFTGELGKRKPVESMDTIVRIVVPDVRNRVEAFCALHGVPHPLSDLIFMSCLGSICATLGKAIGEMAGLDLTMVMVDKPSSTPEVKLPVGGAFNGRN